MKEIKEDNKRWRNIPCSWIARINIVQMSYITQSNLQIQCNPYQATSGIFHRARTNYFTVCTEIQKTSNSQSNLEKRMELEESICLTSDYTTKLQSSRQYGTGTKTEI